MTLACGETATPEECIAALRRLTDGELRRLKQLARIRAIGLHTVDSEDLLHEAIGRMLDGRRRWPRHVPLVVFLLGTMRSISSDHWRRLKDSVVVADGAAVDRGADPTGDPEHRVSAKQTLARVEALFGDDAEALAVIAGMASGQRPDEIQKETGMDGTRYATTQRRIRRRLAREFPGGES